jgi:hypothetical protein
MILGCYGLEDRDHDPELQVRLESSMRVETMGTNCRTESRQESDDICDKVRARLFIRIKPEICSIVEIQEYENISPLDDDFIVFLWKLG